MMTKTKVMMMEKPSDEDKTRVVSTKAGGGDNQVDKLVTNSRQRFFLKRFDFDDYLLQSYGDCVKVSSKIMMTRRGP